MHRLRMLRAVRLSPMLSDPRRTLNAQQRSHCSSEIVYCADDGLDGLMIKFNSLIGVVCSVRAT